MDEKVREFIELCKSDGYKEGEYCIILYKGRYIGDMYTSHVERIYSNLTEFEKRVEQHIAKLDTMWRIDFQVWLYD